MREAFLRAMDMILRQSKAEFNFLSIYQVKIHFYRIKMMSYKQKLWTEAWAIKRRNFGRKPARQPAAGNIMGPGKKKISCAGGNRHFKEKNRIQGGKSISKMILRPGPASKN